MSKDTQLASCESGFEPGWSSLAPVSAPHAPGCAECPGSVLERQPVGLSCPSPPGVGGGSRVGWPRLAQGHLPFPQPAPLKLSWKISRLHQVWPCQESDISRRRRAALPSAARGGQVSLSVSGPARGRGVWTRRGLVDACRLRVGPLIHRPELGPSPCRSMSCPLCASVSPSGTRVK